MKIYIGTKFLGHDSAVFMVDVANKQVTAIASERITRYKHDDIVAIPAIDACIEYLGIATDNVSEVFLANSFLTHENHRMPKLQYEHEINKRKGYKAIYLKDYVASEKLLINRIKNWIFRKTSKKIIAKDYIASVLAARFPNARVSIKSYDHETCHAGGAYYSSGFAKSLLVTMDGHGDHGVFSRVFIAEDGVFTSLCESISPGRAFDFSFGGRKIYSECSVGGLYGYFTDVLGFTPGADEGKVEALAAFGMPIPDLLKSLNASCYVDDLGVIKIDKDILEKDLRIDKLEVILKANSREALSATIQEFLEKIVFNYVAYWFGKSGADAICFSGGVFANVILNMKIFEGITHNIHIMPAMADDGVAEGAAMLAMAENGEDFSWIASEKVPYWGRSYSKVQVLAVLEANKDLIDFRDIGSDWCEAAADCVIDGQVGATYFGRMEWGPRALGHRSIVANATDPGMRKRINLEIKRRPEFQPFCPSILEEDRDTLFERSYANKHMTCAFRMRPEYVGKFPCAVHVDGTARVQFVAKETGEYYDFLKKIKAKIGIGICINTSFNKHGRTMVETPQDAICDFMDTDLDFLVMEGYWITRKR